MNLFWQPRNRVFHVLQNSHAHSGLDEGADEIRHVLLPFNRCGDRRHHIRFCSGAYGPEAGLDKPRIFPVLVPLMVTGEFIWMGFSTSRMPEPRTRRLKKTGDFKRPLIRGVCHHRLCGVYLLLYTAFSGEMKPVIWRAYGGAL